MKKEQALQEFFKSLKLALKNASIYPSDHPARAASVEELKGKADGLFPLINPLRIGVTPRALVVDEESLEKDKLHAELAGIFHIRRIKNLEIRDRVTRDELHVFLNKLSLPPKELLQVGGMKKALSEARIFHITVEELDYSPLLRGEGQEIQEIKDVWTYLLSEAVVSQDERRMIEVADNFDRVALNFNPEEIAENEELRKNLIQLFLYLKENKGEKYTACAKEMVRLIVRNKAFSDESQVAKLKDLVKDLGAEDLSSTLWEVVVTDDAFDSLSFNVFTKLFDLEKHRNVAPSIAEMVRKKTQRNIPPHVKERLKELVSGTASPQISEIYRQTLATLFQDIAPEKELTLDRGLLKRNYRYMLVNLLEKERRRENIAVLMEKILGEEEDIVKGKDYPYLQSLMDALDKRQELSSNPVYMKLKALGVELIERSILEEEESPVLSQFIPHLDRSALGVNFYLEKIFGENKVTPSVLRLFYKLFLDYIFYFDINLSEKASDTEFLNKMVECLKEVDAPASTVTLKSIFSLGDERVKSNVLKAMQHMTHCDEKFLFTLLKKGDLSHKREALRILIKNEGSRQNALEYLFLVPSPFGIRNRVLLNHLAMIDELELEEAASFVLPLSRRRFFWNRNIREKSRELLRRWGRDGKGQ